MVNMEELRRLLGTKTSYKKICEILGENTKGGKGKIVQLKNWKTMFNFYVEGHSYFITEIYEKQKEKIDGRKNNKGGNNSPYGKLLKEIMLEFTDCSYTIAEIMKLIGLIEDNSKVDTFNEQDRNIATYKYQFKNDFRTKLTSALTSLRNEHGCDVFDFEFTYFLIDSEHTKRKDFRVASRKEYDLIIEKTSEAKKIFEEEFDKKFEEFKFNKKMMEEYYDWLISEICTELDIFGFCNCLCIYNSNFQFCDPASKDKLKELYKERMEHIIVTYSTIYKPKEKKSNCAWGRSARVEYYQTPSNVENGRTYWLKNDDNVKRHHASIFGCYSDENEDLSEEDFE